MKDLKEAFGLQLRKIRKERKLTQEVLSELLELSPRQLIRIETGENFPSVETLSKISLLLNVDLKSLFDFEWDEDVMYLATGTYNKPVLRLVRNGEFFTNRQSSPVEMDIPKQIPANDSESLMLKIAKNISKPVTVEYFDNKKRTSIRTFYPNGTIQEVLSKNEFLNSEKCEYINKKIKEFSKNQNKLEFVKLAIDALEDKSALEKLKTIIQGMELTF